MEYEIKVGKIDYYTWKIGAIVLLILVILMVWLHNNPSVGEINDNYWHMGYSDCENNYNFTPDEMMLVNKHRIEMIQNDTVWKYKSITVNVSAEEQK